MLKTKLLLPTLLLMVACTSVSAKDDDVKSATDSEATTPAASNEPTDASSSESIPKTCDVTPKLERTQRLAVIAKVVLDAENELEKNPDSIKDLAVRARLGTFAAGSMNDSVRFVTMDQRCWAHLYEAQTKLAAEDDNGAKSAAEAWQNCLEDQFPNRVTIAQPYFSCFVPSSKSNKK